MIISMRALGWEVDLEEAPTFVSFSAYLIRSQRRKGAFSIVSCIHRSVGILSLPFQDVNCGLHF